MDADSGTNIFLPIIIIVFGILTFVGAWKMFTKAGKPGWGLFIPIYNQYLLLNDAEEIVATIVIDPNDETMTARFAHRSYIYKKSADRL